MGKKWQSLSWSVDVLKWCFFPITQQWWVKKNFDKNYHQIIFFKQKILNKNYRLKKIFEKKFIEKKTLSRKTLFDKNGKLNSSLAAKKNYRRIIDAEVNSFWWNFI